MTTHPETPAPFTDTNLDQASRAVLEQRLHLLFRAVASARNGIIITDCQQDDDPIIYANQAFERLSGYTQAELLGHNCRFLQGPDTDPEAPARIRAALNAGEGLRIQIKNYRKDGQSFWNDLLISPIYDDAGALTHFVGNQLDVTVQKEAELALRDERDMLAQHVAERTVLLQESRNYLASVVETLREPLVVLDDSFRVVSANRAFYRTFHTAPANTEHYPIFALGAGQWDIPRLRVLLADLLPTQNPFEGLEVAHDFPEIGHRVMLLNARQIELEGTAQQRILVTFEDITDRRNSESDAMHHSALTAAVLGSLSAHIAVIDQQGVIIAVNDAWRRFAVAGDVPAEAAAFLGSNYLELLRHAPPDDGLEAPAVLRGIEAVLAGQQPSFALEYPCDTPTAKLWFVLHVTPLQHDGGGAVIAHTDITDRKQIEQRKDDFISMASHELKTPITSIKLTTQLLRRQIARSGDATMLPRFDQMNSQLDRLTRLVQDMLDVSRLNSGKLSVQHELFDLHQLVVATLDTLRTTAPAYTIMLHGAITRMVWGDAARIEQVVINLLTNAIKYAPQDQVIEVMLEEYADMVIVSVRDRGMGVPVQYQERVFDRFYQVADPGLSTYPGLGMGLYISRQIIERHHGRIWVESIPGNGACFRFTLPMRASTDADGVDEAGR